MDWAKAIELNRDALVRMLAALFAGVGLTPGGNGSEFANIRLSRHIRGAILHVLRPAESAARRLIVIAAEVMAWEGYSVSAPPARPAPVAPIPRSNSGHVPAFPLLDTMKRFEFERYPRGLPRISVPGFTDRGSTDTRPPMPGDLVDCRRLMMRLETLHRALDDLPGQARRLTRWRARRNQSQKPGRLSPMRPGRPPGSRKRPIHEVDHVLRECHALAHDALDPPKPAWHDTS